MCEGSSVRFRELLTLFTEHIWDEVACYHERWSTAKVKQAVCEVCEVGIQGKGTWWGGGGLKVRARGTTPVERPVRDQAAVNTASGGIVSILP